MWSKVAGAWAEHAEYIDERMAEITEKLLELTAPQPGERVLELACGPAGTGLAAAQLVGPQGEVVLSDVAVEMTGIGAARAAALGFRNVRARELDLEDIDEPDGSYDVVLCREGLMFAFDPARAAREIRRVLKPGGRVAVSVWGPREKNPWLSIVFDAVSAQLGKPTPPPGVPSPFSLPDSEALADLLRSAGLADVLVSDLPVATHAGSFEEWSARTTALAGPLASLLVSLPEGATQALRARLRAAARPYETPAGLSFPGVALLASARRV
jgi:SAM-dependent methyltransferase